MDKDFIKDTRLKLGLTLEEFGKLFNPPASQSLVSRWERGVNLPNAKRMKRIKELRMEVLENALSEFTTDELINELNRRGFKFEMIAQLRKVK